jgi:hypothetical protein
VSKEKKKCFSWCIQHTKNHKKWIKIKKVMLRAPNPPPPQNVAESRTPKKKQPLSRTKPVSNHPKIYLYVALFLLDFKDDL